MLASRAWEVIFACSSLGSWSFELTYQPSPSSAFSKPEPLGLSARCRRTGSTDSMIVGKAW